MRLFKRYARRLIQKAQAALLKNQISNGHRLARKGVFLDPSLEAGWLILAATSQPETSRNYLLKVLEINPDNEKAQKGLAWVEKNLELENPAVSRFSSTYQYEISLIEKNLSHTAKNKSFLRRVFSRWQSVFGLFCCLLILFTALTAPLLAPLEKNQESPWFKVVCDRVRCQSQPPDDFLPLGTVKEYDVYHTLIWGTRQSLGFGLLTALSTALIGVLIGTFAAYANGWIGRLLMRICDAFLAFPLIAAVALFAQISTMLSYPQRGIISLQVTSTPEKVNFLQSIIVKTDPVLMAIILFSWMTFARIMHSQVLQIKKTEFVEAAFAIGARQGRIIFRHILPNSLSPAIVVAARDIGRMVVIQSSLTFIGIGDSSAWATLLNAGKDHIIGPGGNLLTRWWIYLPITLALVFFGITWSIIGDELNYWFNPKNA